MYCGFCSLMMVLGWMGRKCLRGMRAVPRVGGLGDDGERDLGVCGGDDGRCCGR